MLSGDVIKVAGLYVIFRIFFNMFIITYDIALVLTVIGTLSMIVGVFLAIGQWDLKRLLAYSSISQIGYIVLGISLGMMIMSKGGDKSLAVLAIFGGLFHLINHAVFKGLLFLNAGAIEYRTGTRDLNQLGGLSEKMPVTSSTSLVASLSISGIPPFNGFFSKLFIIIAAIKAQYYLLGIIAIIASIITLAYFLKFQKSVFYGRKKSENNSIKEVPFAMCFSMILLAILCLGLSSLIIPDVREAVIEPAVNVLINATEYSVNVLSH
jgi:multicomponent Na+:H+ antiporter subunit D